MGLQQLAPYWQTHVASHSLDAYQDYQTRQSPYNDRGYTPRRVDEGLRFTPRALRMERAWNPRRIARQAAPQYHQFQAPLARPTYQQYDLQTHMGHPALHPKTLLGIALRRIQGELISTSILPERSVPNKEFVYREYGDIGGLAPEVDEGDPTPLRGIDYHEVVTRCVELRLGTLVTEQSQKWLDRDIIQDNLEQITADIAMKQEAMAFETMLDETKYDPSQIITLTASETWDDPANRPQDSISRAKAIIRKYGHVNANTLVVNSDDYSLLEQALPMNVWSQAGPYAQQFIGDGMVPRIGGLDIITTDAMKWTSDDDDTLEFLIDGSALVLKRGPELGFTAVCEPLTVRRFPVPDRRAIEVQAFKTLRPVITRRTHMCLIKNISS